MCVAIYTERSLRRIGNLFLASLAIADLFVASLVMTFAGVNDILGEREWQSTEACHQEVDKNLFIQWSWKLESRNFWRQSLQNSTLDFNLFYDDQVLWICHCRCCFLHHPSWIIYSVFFSFTLAYNVCSLIATGYWIFGAKFCDTWVAFDVMCSTASILNLCAISLDRYIHIKDPLR